MDEATRNEVAECLERLADEAEWNTDLHKRCYELVGANWDNELLKYIHDDLIHYDGLFHSRNILGFRVEPNCHELDDYRHEFRSIAAALRARLSLVNAKKTIWAISHAVCEVETSRLHSPTGQNV